MFSNENLKSLQNSGKYSEIKHLDYSSKIGVFWRQLEDGIKENRV